MPSKSSCADYKSYKCLYSSKFTPMQKKFIPFIPDALALNLKHPVALITRRTGDDPSNVSAYLRGVKRPGNGFLVRFYTAFEDDLAEIGIQRDVKTFIRITPHKKRTTKEAVWRTLVRKLDRKIELLEKIAKEFARDREEHRETKKEIARIGLIIADLHNRGLISRQRPSFN
jgi:hypothetical protein